MPTIDIYPECQKPHWMKLGACCYCLGEGNEKFTVDRVFKNAATLLTASGCAHGMESFTKLYKSMDELEERRPELKKTGIEEDTHLISTQTEASSVEDASV